MRKKESNQTLVIDCDYRPVCVVTPRRAVNLIFRGAVEVLEKWDEELVKGFNLPAVIRLTKTRITRMQRKTKFRRAVVFARDHWTCQYCGSPVNRTTATIDHIIPKSRGGESSWSNCVTSCLKCNSKKGSKIDVFPSLKPKPPHQLHFHVAHGINYHPSWSEYVDVDVFKRE